MYHNQRCTNQRCPSLFLESKFSVVGLCISLKVLAREEGCLSLFQPSPLLLLFDIDKTEKIKMSNQEQGQAMQSSSIPSLPQLITQDTSGGSLGGTHTTGGGESTSQALAEMEIRVQER